MNTTTAPDMKQHDRVASRLQPIFAIAKEIFTTSGVNLIGRLLIKHMQENRVYDGNYHDSAHMFAVLIEADEIAKHYGYGIDVRRNIFFAALYHDYDHSKGVDLDIYNISNAINAFLKHAKLYNFEEAFGLTAQRLALIVEMILNTHYPFTFPPTSAAAACLRDADLLMCIQSDAEYFAKGLMKEFANKGEEVEITPEIMRNFALNQRFYNKYAEDKIKNYDGKI